MKFRLLFYCAMVCLTGSGCRLSDNFFRTTVYQPLHYAIRRDERQSLKYFRRLAQDVLSGRSLEQGYTGPLEHAVAALSPGKSWRQTFPVDYARGFEDGFVDFLDAGGTGEIAPLPPRRYWRARYQNPDGQQAIQQWFQGYEDGVIAARASGYRDFVVIPVSDPLIATTQAGFHGKVQTTQATIDVSAWSTGDTMQTHHRNLFERMRRLPPVIEMKPLPPYEALPAPDNPPAAEQPGLPPEVLYGTPPVY